MDDLFSKHLFDYWYVVCKSSKLKNKPIPVKVLNQDIVLFRSTSGKPKALIDVCPHRNMRLSRGRVTDKGIQCCYHGWTFEGGGRCTDIPALILSKTEKTNSISVKTYSVKEENDLIWIYMGNSSPKIKPSNFPLRTNNQTQTWIMERTFQGNAFNCVENFLDVPHTVFVHKKWFRNENRNNISFDVKCGVDWVEANFLDEKPIDTYLGRFLFPRRSTISHTDRFKLPFNTRVDYRFGSEGHIVIMSHCTPVTKNETRVFTYMAVKIKRLRFFRKILKPILRPITEKILNQDVDIIRKHNEDLNRNLNSNYVFHKTDAIAKEIKMLLEKKPLTHLPRKGEFQI